MTLQLSFAEAEYDRSKSLQKSRKALFLAEMSKAVPWDRLEKAITPYYAKVPEKAGRRPYPLRAMLAIHLMQHWYNLSDPAMESELYDSMAMRKFAGLGGLHNPTPDETTILNFRHMLERHGLSSVVFDIINEYLDECGVSVSNGTIVDATIIEAASSTKNKAKARDPEMHSTKKGNQYHFGEKMHVGVDGGNGRIHSVAVTAANVSDIEMMDDMIRDEDEYASGDSGYRGIEKRTRHQNVKFGISMMRSKRKKVKGTLIDTLEKAKSGIRAKVEHVFRVLKDQFHYRKVRFKGLCKNAEAAFMKCGLINLYLFRKTIIQRA